MFLHRRQSLLHSNTRYSRPVHNRPPLNQRSPSRPFEVTRAGPQPFSTSLRFRVRHPSGSQSGAPSSGSRLQPIRPRPRKTAESQWWGGAGSRILPDAESHSSAVPFQRSGQCQLGFEIVTTALVVAQQTICGAHCVPAHMLMGRADCENDRDLGNHKIGGACTGGATATAGEPAPAHASASASAPDRELVGSC